MPRTFTGSTDALRLVKTCIGFVVSVAPWAVCLGSLSTARDLSALALQPSLNIDEIGHCLKMRRSHTSMDAAKMVNNQTIRDCSVGEYVSTHTPHSIPEDAVTAVFLPCIPKPAWAKFGRITGERPSLINLRPEVGNTLFGGMLTVHREPILSGVMGRAVTAAPSPNFTTLGAI